MPSYGGLVEHMGVETYTVKIYTFDAERIIRMVYAIIWWKPGVAPGLVAYRCRVVTDTKTDGRTELRYSYSIYELSTTCCRA